VGERITGLPGEGTLARSRNGQQAGEQRGEQRAHGEGIHGRFCLLDAARDLA